MRSLAAAVQAVEEPYEAGPTGLLVIVLLAIGIFLLGRSMVKHIRRVPASFDDEDDDDDDGDEPTGTRPDTSPEAAEPDPPDATGPDGARRS